MTNKGSTWNIWDFHIHSPFSSLNNGFGDVSQDTTWDNYFNNLDIATRDKKIVAVGITDYFSIEGYKRVIKHREDEKKKAKKSKSDDYFLKGVFVFPNAELRLLPATSQERPINIHLLFSPEIADELDDKLFSHLTFPYKNSTFSCVKSELIRLGKAHANSDSITDDKAYEIGTNQFKVTADDLSKALKLNAHIRKNTLVVVSNSSNDGASGIQHASLAATRDQIYFFADAIFSATPNDREHFLGEKNLSSKEIAQRYRTLKPCIHGSDAHEISKIGEPDKKRHCWLKSEVTWEGLTQILYEPKDRVRIQENSPEPDKSIYTIEKIIIPETQVNENLSIAPLSIDANWNLIAIIGGRGSGKTALLDLIASCFKAGDKLREEEHSYSFIHRLYIAANSPSIKKKQAAANPIKVNLEFKSGDLFEKNVGSSFETFEKADVIYLTQNHFDEFSANPDTLNSHIIELVFENYSDEKRKYQELNDENNVLERQLQNLNLDIEQLRVDIEGKKEIEEINLNQKLGDKADYEQRIANKENEQGKKDDTVRDLSEKLNYLKTKKRSAENLLDKLEQFTNFISSFESDYSDYIIEINNELASFTDESVIAMPSTVIGITDIQKILGDNKLLLASVSEKNANEIDGFGEQINALQGIDKDIAELHQKLNSIKTEIIDIETRINEIIEKQKLLEGLEEKRLNVYVLMAKQTSQLRSFLQAMIEKFEFGKDDMLSKLRFTAIVDLHKNKEYFERITEKIDNRLSGATLQTDFAPILETLDFGLNNDDTNYDYSKATTGLHDLAKRLIRKKNTSESELCNILFSRFFKIGLHIEFNDKPINELSMGERAIVLLKILLSLDDKPLLIDQPEEHLDNRYIYTELMPAFRTAKKRRQIIIATHNANLVVNTDAEQVIVADYSNGKLSYTVGTLENTGIRENIKNILEGGDEAFKKREEKYGYRL